MKNFFRLLCVLLACGTTSLFAASATETVTTGDSAGVHAAKVAKKGHKKHRKHRKRAK